MLDAATQPLAVSHNLNHQGCCGNAPGRWAVAQTHPQAERWAHGNLTRLGYETYLPLYATERADRVVPTLRHRVLVPLFPRYVFVRHDRADVWRPIREAPGVSAVLTAAGNVQWVRHGAVEALQATEEQRRRFTTRSTKFSTGDPCRITVGIFAHHLGVVTMVEHEVVMVSVLFLGQLRDVALSTDSIEARDS